MDAVSELGPAIVGEVVVLLIVLAIVCLVLREFVRVTLKVIAAVAALTALAIWLGFLDQTVVLDFLVQVGDWVMSGVDKASSAWARRSAG